MQELNYIVNRFTNAVKFNNSKLFINNYDLDAINNALIKHKNRITSVWLKNILKGLIYIKLDEKYFNTFKINILLFDKLLNKTIYEIQPKEYLENEFNKVVNIKLNKELELEYTNDRLNEYVDYIKDYLKDYLKIK